MQSSAGQIAEFRSRFAWYRDRPVSFSHTFLAASPVDKKDPTKRHLGQIRWLKHANEAINVLVPGNRFGKSYVTAMKHIHKCIFRIGQPEPWDWSERYETISISVSADQAQIIFDAAKFLLSTPQAKPLIKRIYATPFPRIIFFNGAVMHCRSAHDDGKYIDGHAYRYVSVDEAGHFKNELKKLINGVVLMRMAGGGDLDLIGTPKGFGDLFWYANRGLRGVKGYYTQRGSIYDNPFLNEEDIKMRDQLLASADPRLREQVLYGAFVSDEGMAFTQDQLEQAFVDGMPAHVEPIPGHRYVQAWDLARQTDWTVGVTFDVTTRPYRMVDFVRLQKVPWETIYNTIKMRAREYNVLRPVIDATGPGGDVIEEELVKRGIFVDPVKTTNLAAKLNMINTLQTAMDDGRQVIGKRTVLDEAGIPRDVPDLEPPGGEWGLIRMPPITEFVDEFGVYQIKDKDLQTDTVMAVALAIGSIYDGSVLYEPLLNVGIFGPEEGGAYGGEVRMTREVNESDVYGLAADKIGRAMADLDGS